ncbi:MAG TPA: hypothetical protein VFE93_13550, partial [Myxococcaceae bacterium]|nr:hypothetical protein [Myxococcaceae bacterium]
ETARDSLFLAGQPISRLPWLYLAVTVVVLPVTQLQALAGRRRGELPGRGGPLCRYRPAVAPEVAPFSTHRGRASSVPRT